MGLICPERVAAQVIVPLEAIEVNTSIVNSPEEQVSVPAQQTTTRDSNSELTELEVITAEEETEQESFVIKESHSPTKKKEEPVFMSEQEKIRALERYFAQKRWKGNCK